MTETAPRAAPRTMKSYLIRTRGATMQLELHERPVPEPKANEVRVRIRAAGLNRGEFVAGHGLHAPDAPPRPAGFEAAGEVEALGPGVTRYAIGDRLMGRVDGAFSEYGVMHVDECLRAPARLSWEQAAGAIVVYLTAHDALIGQGRLKAGEWMLVAGASSGVGVASIQLARALGARVIGTSGSREKLARLQALGLDVPLHTRQPDFVPAVLEATGGRGADVAVNNVGGTMFPALVEALGFEGRLATVGYVDGVVHADIDLAALHKKRLCLYGVSNKMRTMQHRVAAMQAYARDVLPLFEDGRLATLVDRVFPFDALDEAKAMMERDAHVGKLVVRMP